GQPGDVMRLLDQHRHERALVPQIRAHALDGDRAVEPVRTVGGAQEHLGMPAEPDLAVDLVADVRAQLGEVSAEDGEMDGAGAPGASGAVLGLRTTIADTASMSSIARGRSAPAMTLRARSTALASSGFSSTSCSNVARMACWRVGRRGGLLVGGRFGSL